MGLNCKQGDLAFVVRSGAGNEGKIVRCVAWLGRPPLGHGDAGLSDCWHVEPELPSRLGVINNACSDSRLRPIRGLPESETETISDVIELARVAPERV